MAIHRIDIVSGLFPDSIATNRLLCCEGCQTAIVTFENVHNSDLNITNFVINDAGTGTAWTITSINGSPPSFPFFIAEGDTFTMDIEICYDGVTDPLGTPTAYFVTVEHGNDASWLFEMTCNDLNPFINDFVFTFTDIPVGTTSVQYIGFDNQTLGAISLQVEVSGCGSTLPISNAITIPAFSTGLIPLEWTPTSASDTLSCTTYIYSDNCSSDSVIEIIGNAIAADCECLCCLNIEIQTDQNYLNADGGFCIPDNVYSKSAFLDKKTVVFSMKYDPGLVTGFRLQFNPALFGLECISPFEGNNTLPVGYFIQYLSGAHPDGTAQPMVLNGAGSNALNLKNWEVFFRPTDAIAGEFNVEFTFYMTQDFEQFLTNITFDNDPKLKRNTFSSPTNWDNTFPSVYNSIKSLQAAFHVTDPATLVGDSPFRCGILTCSSFTGRFYNLGLNNGPSEFTNPVFALTRTNGTVTNFSTIETTEVKFSIDVPVIYGAARPKIVFHLFDINATNNTVDFLAASDSSRFTTAVLPGTGVLDNHLVRPGTLGTVGGDWAASLHVGTTVNPSTTYRMAAIVYGSAGEMVNTFLSEPITVTTLPDMDCDCHPEITSTFNQYWQKTNADCFRPVGKERIGHQLILDPGDFDDCLSNWGFEIDDWRSVLANVRLNIYKRTEDFPNPGKTTFFQYESHLSVRNNAFLGNYQNFGDLIVAESGPTQIVTFINNRRVRFDNTLFSGGQILTANSSTYMNRVPAGPIGGIYVSTLNVLDTWINNDIFFEYVLTFDLTAYVGQPFLWNVVKAFKVNAIDFEPINSGFEQMLFDVTFEGLDPVTGVYVTIEEPICFSDWSAVRLTYQSDREGNFLFFIEPEPFGLPVLQENDEMVGANQMTQLSSPLVLSMDTSFDPVTFQASVILDAPQFENKTYRFCGYISTPEEPAICEYFVFHAKTASSPTIIVPTPQVGNTYTGTFNSTPFAASLTMRTSNGTTLYPLPGETYVFEYSFSVATTQVLDFRMGTLSTSGPVTFSIPVGSTTGSVSFVWGADTSGFYTMRTGLGTVSTGTFAFKIGNSLCP